MVLRQQHMFNYTSNLFNNLKLSLYRIQCPFIPFKFQFIPTLKVPYKGALSTNTKVDRLKSNTTVLYEHVSSNDKKTTPELYIN